MKWYKNLTIHQKINLKEITPLIVGHNFQDLIKILGFKQLVYCLEEKLKMEGILN
jgi:hypothetical protein